MKGFSDTTILRILGGFLSSLHNKTLNQTPPMKPIPFKIIPYNAPPYKIIPYNVPLYKIIPYKIPPYKIPPYINIIDYLHTS
jgi:hypothetical protein